MRRTGKDSDHERGGLREEGEMQSRGGWQTHTHISVIRPGGVRPARLLACGRVHRKVPKVIQTH